MSQLKPIEGISRDFIASKNLMVLRDSLTHKALNVSYTVEGLKWTVNFSGKKLIYFRNAWIDVSTDEGIPTTSIVGDLTPSRKVYVEKFIPRDHYDHRGRLTRIQISEYTAVDKALKLLYHIRGFEPESREFL